MAKCTAEGWELKGPSDFRDIFKYLRQFVFGFVKNKGTAKDLLNNR